MYQIQMRDLSGPMLHRLLSRKCALSPASRMPSVKTEADDRRGHAPKAPILQNDRGRQMPGEHSHVTIDWTMPCLILVGSKRFGDLVPDHPSLRQCQLAASDFLVFSRRDLDNY